MLRFEDIVFGPVHSRRLGNSLGINLLPQHGKLCNFDCIYCECGWNRDGRQDKVMPDAAHVKAALERRFPELKADGVKVDSITFSGNGEPTLNPDFPEIIDIVTGLRDIWFPDAVVSVLSNASRVSDDRVFKALCKVDNPIMKIDAPSEGMVNTVNRPSPSYSLERTIDGLMKFEGNFILQTMFLKGAGADSSGPEWISGWTDLVRKLRPREVMVYTLDRETPEKGLVKFQVQEMADIVAPLIAEGFNIQIRG